MRRGSSSGQSSGWNYDDPDKPLAENFKVLVDGIGDNDELQNVVLKRLHRPDCSGTIVPARLHRMDHQLASRIRRWQLKVMPQERTE